MHYRIETIDDPRRSYLLVGNLDFEAHINASCMADYLSDHNVVHFDGKNIIYYQGSWHEISDAELRLIILRAFPLKPNGHPYHINESSIKNTIQMWKQGWVAHPERFSLDSESKEK